MKLPDEITPEGEAALIECLREFARLGRQLRERREQAEKENRADAGNVERESQNLVAVQTSFFDEQG